MFRNHRANSNVASFPLSCLSASDAGLTDQTCVGAGGGLLLLLIPGKDLASTSSAHLPHILLWVLATEYALCCKYP